MPETLRLHTPVPTSKQTDATMHDADVGGARGAEGSKKTIVLPPETMLAPTYAALQTDPKYWGTGSFRWRPSRWIKVICKNEHPAVANAVTKDEEAEELIPPYRGTYLAFSVGARDFPKRKFSQVEFVAAMATLFLDYRVDPVTMKGETMGAARKRVLHLIESDSAPVLLLQMLHPKRAPLVWSRRS